jgi:hypothetical protein
MPINTRNIFLLLLCMFVFPAYADAGSFSVSTEPQTIAPSTASGAITVTSGTPVTASTCVLLSSNSASGQFSSSATNWTPVPVVTMSKNTSNRSFFYKDTAEGTFTLTIRIVQKPDTVSASCASWADAASAVQETLTHSITVGTGSGQPSSEDNHDSTSSGSTTNTPPQQTQTTVVGSVGSETLHVTIKTQGVVVVGGGSFFSGSASDSHGPTGNGTRYLWNFGDGATDEGQTVFHTYMYPGKYVATLTAGSGNEAGIVRTTIDATPAQVGVLAQPDGSVVLSNQSSQELNIGLWSITSATSTFSIPQDTILLANMSVRFSPQVMHMSAAADTSLRYANGSLVTVSVKPAQSLSTAPSHGEAGFASASPQSSQKPQRNLGATPPPSPRTATTSLAAVGQASAPVSVWVYVLGAIGVVLVGLGFALYALPGFRVPHWPFVGTKPPEDEFDIE